MQELFFLQQNARTLVITLMIVPWRRKKGRHILQRSKKMIMVSWLYLWPRLACFDIGFMQTQLRALRRCVHCPMFSLFLFGCWLVEFSIPTNSMMSIGLVLYPKREYMSRISISWVLHPKIGSSNHRLVAFSILRNLGFRLVVFSILNKWALGVNWVFPPSRERKSRMIRWVLHPKTVQVGQDKVSSVATAVVVKSAEQ